MSIQDPILVTGGAGFIGTNFVLGWLRSVGSPVVNLDLLTYAGNLSSLDSLKDDPRHIFVPGDICDAALVGALLRDHRPRAVIHFAAESHVDRSIVAPDAFVRTNVTGTLTLLEQARLYWSALQEPERVQFRFVHISTDEVYGTLAPGDPPSTETSAYAPNNPYAASKAAADHLVRAWHRTWGLPVVTINSSNNYGPMQSPEKLIPLTILHAVEGRPLPVYGDGGQIRDWLFVEDTCAAIGSVVDKGRVGTTYNVGGDTQRTNLEVVTAICDLIDEMHPDAETGTRRRLITLVPDRPGHDRRYATDFARIRSELGWKPKIRFEQGLRQTVAWYLEHPAWVASARNGAHREWMAKNYADRASR